MEMMDKNRSYGKIAPPLMEDGLDRPAHYEQDGHLYDAHGRRIIPGQPSDKSQEVSTDDGDHGEALTPATLIAQADTLPWAQFKAEARRVLGPDCPGGKAAIVAALKSAIIKFEEHREKKSDASAPADNAGAVGVDLASWARGRREYLFQDIQKELRTRYHKQVSERLDAVDFLIQEGVITAAEARQDV